MRVGADSSPLLSHGLPDAVVAYRAGRAIEARQLLADAAQVAERLPRGRHVLNVCVDRYQFTVGLAACLISGRVSLLPSSHAPEVIRQLARLAPGAFCLTDEESCGIDLPHCRYADCLGGKTSRRASMAHVPHIAHDQLAAIVFTSGSTGVPLPHEKRWGPLARCVREGASRLGLPGGRPHALIGTVPPQHMYGLESTVLLALQGGHCLTAERPFYPADICAAIATVPRPRALVTTPVHLRTLLAAGIELPPLDLLVSATAPLSRQLALEAEDRLNAHLIEIYGSTETGQIASRRTVESAAWRLWPGVRLKSIDGVAHAQGGHVEQWTRMCDVLEVTGEDEFLLHGRTADLVDVAGKRSSFGYLNAQLNAIPGVIDGVFFMRDRCDGGITGVSRLAAAVVAPGLSAPLVMQQLRQRIDPVFLPRPLLLIDRLPRDAMGKLPRRALQTLADGAHED